MELSSEKEIEKSEVYLPCPNCSKQATLIIPQITPEINEYNLFDPESFVDKLNESQVRLLKFVVEKSENYFVCGSCKNTFSFNEYKNPIDNSKKADIIREMLS